MYSSKEETFKKTQERKSKDNFPKDHCRNRQETGARRLTIILVIWISSLWPAPCLTPRLMILPS